MHCMHYVVVYCIVHLQYRHDIASGVDELGVMRNWSISIVASLSTLVVGLIYNFFVQKHLKSCLVKVSVACQSLVQHV
jgi:hypothetical protein